MLMRPMIDSDDELDPNLSGDDDTYTELNRQFENGSPDAYFFGGGNQGALSINYAETPSIYYSDFGEIHDKSSAKLINSKFKLQSSNENETEMDNMRALKNKAAFINNRPQTHPIQQARYNQ